MSQLPAWESVLSPTVDREKLFALRDELNKKLDDPRWAHYRAAVENATNFPAKSWDVGDGAVRFHADADLTTEQQSELLESLNAFRPWKKGPYEIFGQKIDSEWRSDIKWDRVYPHLGSIKGEVIADIGCHNGYFMYRMIEAGAKHVIGFEPVPVNAYNHQLLQAFHPMPNIAFELFGVEHIDLFPETFDTIFCMGILYHHTDPVGLLRKMKTALKPKGRIVIDCQGIPGSESLSLTPSGRYAGASGVWFLPTLPALQNWIKRAGLSQQRCIYSEALTSDEQRATSWAEMKSLNDFLDPNDKTKTVEGYPAPYRHYVIAKV